MPIAIVPDFGERTTRHGKPVDEWLAAFGDVATDDELAAIEIALAVCRARLHGDADFAEALRSFCEMEATAQ